MLLYLDKHNRDQAYGLGQCGIEVLIQRVGAKILEYEIMISYEIVNWACKKHDIIDFYPSKIEWDLTNGPLSKLLEHVRAIRYSGLGVRSVGPVGDFLDSTQSYIE